MDLSIAYGGDSCDCPVEAGVVELGVGVVGNHKRLQPCTKMVLVDLLVFSYKLRKHDPEA